MQLPAIRERIPQPSFSRKRVFFILFFFAGLSLFTILIEITYLFYSDYNLKDIFRRDEEITGVVTKKEKATLSIEDSKGQIVEINVEGRVLHGDSYNEEKNMGGEADVIEASQIKVGQHIHVVTLKRDSRLREVFGSDTLIHVWD